jgi:hypothetical protein
LFFLGGIFVQVSGRFRASMLLGLDPGGRIPVHKKNYQIKILEAISDSIRSDGDAAGWRLIPDGV